MIGALGLLRMDIEAHIPEAGRGGSRLARARRATAVVALSAGFHACLLHRSAHACRRFGPPGRAGSALLTLAIRWVYGCSIAPTARIGGGLILPHPQGIVIGPGVEIGPRAWVFQNATLGGSPGREGMPRIGSDARIYPGAVLAGPIVVGDNAVVGANAVVTVDMPDRTMARSPSPEFAPVPDRMRADG